MECVYGLRHHFPGHEVSFLVDAKLFNDDLAGYDVGCAGHRMGMHFGFEWGGIVILKTESSTAPFEYTS